MLADAGRREQRRDDEPDLLLQLTPRRVVRRPQRPAQHPVLGDRVGRLTGPHRTPDENGPRARVDLPRQQRRQLSDHQAERVHQVGRQLGPRGVPARRGEPQLQQVAGGRDRAHPGADLADLQPRVAVQREDPLHPVHRAIGDHVHRPAGLHLLRRLEDQPHPAGQPGRGRECEPGAQQHRRVRVVPAGVHDAVDGRGEGQAGVLGERQRVHVGAQRDASLSVTNVTYQARAAGERARLQPRVHEHPRDQRRRTVLAPGELGDGMQ